MTDLGFVWYVKSQLIGDTRVRNLIRRFINLDFGKLKIFVGRRRRCKKMMQQQNSNSKTKTHHKQASPPSLTKTFLFVSDPIPAIYIPILFSIHLTAGFPCHK